MRKSLASRTALIAPLLMTLAACDPIYGLRDSVQQTGSAADTCVEKTLSQTTGVISVQLETKQNDGNTLLGTGPIHGSLIRYYRYGISEDTSAILQIYDAAENQTQYSNYMLQLGTKIPPEKIARALPVMREVELNLARQCGILFSGNIKEN